MKKLISLSWTNVLLAIGLGIAVLVFVITAGHVIFLPLLFIPFGLFSFGHRRRAQ